MPSNDNQYPKTMEAPPAQPGQPILLRIVNSHETFKNLSGGFQSLVIAIGLIVGGIWAIARFSILFESRIAEAQATKAEADAIIAARSARSSVILSIDVNARQVRPDQPDTQAQPGEAKWVLVELSVKNIGTEEYRIDLKDKVRFYVAPATDVDASGTMTFGEMQRLQFDYPDKTIQWFVLRPGAEVDRLRAVQKVATPGLYIARFSIPVKDSAASESREYSSQTYFYVQ